MNRTIVASNPEHNRDLGIRGNLIAGGLVAGVAFIGIKFLGPHFVPTLDSSMWNIISSVLSAVIALLTYPLSWAWRKFRCEIRRRRAASALAPHEVDTFIMPQFAPMQTPTWRLPDYDHRHRDCFY
jgi:hypothetical protein